MVEKGKKMMQQVQQYISKGPEKGPKDKKTKVNKAIKITGAVVLIFFFLAIFENMGAASAREEEMSSEITELQRKLRVNEVKNETLRTENSKLTLVKTEYEAYKEKMSPYESLEKAEAEAKIAEIEKKEAEEKAKKEAEEKAKAEKKKQEEEAEKARLAEEEAKGYETGTTYDQLARTPDDYEFTKVKFSGKVVQVIEGEGTTQIRFAVNDDYDTIIYADIPSSLTENNRVLEDDYLTLSGISMGLLTYESTLGGEITIPSITVDKIDR